MAHWLPRPCPFVDCGQRIVAWIYSNIMLLPQQLWPDPAQIQRCGMTRFAATCKPERMDMCLCLWTACTKFWRAPGAINCKQTSLTSNRVGMKFWQKFLQRIHTCGAVSAVWKGRAIHSRLFHGPDHLAKPPWTNKRPADTTSSAFRFQCLTLSQRPAQSYRCHCRWVQIRCHYLHCFHTCPPPWSQKFTVPAKSSTPWAPRAVYLYNDKAFPYVWILMLQLPQPIGMAVPSQVKQYLLASSEALPAQCDRSEYPAQSSPFALLHPPRSSSSLEDVDRFTFPRKAQRTSLLALESKLLMSSRSNAPRDVFSDWFSAATITRLHTL